MTTQADREFDWETGRELERKDAEIMWLKSSLVSLLVLAEAKQQSYRSRRRLLQATPR